MSWVRPGEALEPPRPGRFAVAKRTHHMPGFRTFTTGNVMKEGISPAQLRAARALVGWSRDDLAAATGTNVRTLARLEAGETEPRTTTLAGIRAALEAQGVEFTNGDAPGVRLRK